MGDFNTDPEFDLYKYVTGDGGRKLDWTVRTRSAVLLVRSPHTTCKERNGRGVPHDRLHYGAKIHCSGGPPSIPAVEELSPGMLPNWDYPSDHLSIGADLALAL